MNDVVWQIIDDAIQSGDIDSLSNISIQFIVDYCIARRFNIPHMGKLIRAKPVMLLLPDVISSGVTLNDLLRIFGQRYVHMRAKIIADHPSVPDIRLTSYQVVAALIIRRRNAR